MLPKKLIFPGTILAVTLGLALLSLLMPAGPVPDQTPSVAAPDPKSKPAPIVKPVAAPTPKPAPTQPAIDTSNARPVPPSERIVEAYWSGQWWPAKAIERTDTHIKVEVLPKDRPSTTIWLLESLVRRPVAAGAEWAGPGAAQYWK